MRFTAFQANMLCVSSTRGGPGRSAAIEVGLVLEALGWQSLLCQS
jgi:hypothetical protein